MPRVRRVTPPPIRRRARAGVAAMLLVLAACGPANPPGSTAPSALAPSASPTGLASQGPSAPAGSPDASADAAIYQQIEAQVREIRGLPQKEPVTPTIISPDQMAQIVRGQVTTETPPEQLGAYERLYHAMGILPKTDKLAEVFGDLLSSQVGGLYVPEDKKLYVVSKAGGLGPLEKFLFSHEYTHALQDQTFDLRAFQAGAPADQSDRQLARQSVYEGDAYTTMTLWLQKDAPGDMGAILAGANDPAAQAALARIPPLISAQIVFAALQGTVWIFGLEAQGGYDAVNDAFRHPPESTEQVLHPDKWLSREPPIDVQLPSDLVSGLGTGWSKGLEDTFGEHQLGVWITAAAPLGGLPEPPPDSAAGWGGDRMALYDGPNGSWAIVFKTVWDTAKDAAEFETGIAPRVAAAAGPGKVLPGEGGAVRWIVIGSDDAVLGKVAGLLGLAG